ncbi:MAG: tRNA(His) guanylyltransferase Thg1 family protein [Erysipelotrichales bacterium]|nr:tRNA(His) guanylyltransferase Thg1 family protein [Erysipelotrichales bacterium]
MKHFEQRLEIDQNKNCIIRLDGVGMTKGFKTSEIINKSFESAMEKTMFKLMKYFPSAVFAYQFSDEISILFDLKINDKRIMNRVEKLISITSGAASSIFTEVKKDNEIHVFDSRLSQPPEIEKYFESRQEYAIWQFIEKLRNKNISPNAIRDSKLHDSKIVKQALASLDPPVDYESYPKRYRNGFIMFKKNGKIVTEEAEIFSETFNYLNNRLPNKFFNYKVIEKDVKVQALRA